MPTLRVRALYLGAWRVALAHARAFLPALLLFVVVAIARAASHWAFPTADFSQEFFQLEGPERRAALAELFRSVVPSEIVNALLIPLVVAGTAITLAIADDIRAGRPASNFRDAWARVSPGFPALLAIGIASFVAVDAEIATSYFLMGWNTGVLALFLIVVLPTSVWLAAKWSLVVPAILFEGRSPFDALKRSTRLTDGSKLAIIIALAAVILTIALPSALLRLAGVPPPVDIVARAVTQVVDPAVTAIVILIAYTTLLQQDAPKSQQARDAAARRT